VGRDATAAFNLMTEKAFYVTLRVAHDEGLSDGRAIDAVLEALAGNIEKNIFPVFATGRDGEEYTITLVDLEVL